VPVAVESVPVFGLIVHEIAAVLLVRVAENDASPVPAVRVAVVGETVSVGVGVGEGQAVKIPALTSASKQSFQ
jgi:hypothetical protein